jgi:hypothetical protein
MRCFRSRSAGRARGLPEARRELRRVGPFGETQHLLEVGPRLDPDVVEGFGVRGSVDRARVRLVAHLDLLGGRLSGASVVRGVEVHDPISPQVGHSLKAQLLDRRLEPESAAHTEVSQQRSDDRCKRRRRGSCATVGSGVPFSPMRVASLVRVLAAAGIVVACGEVPKPEAGGTQVQAAERSSVAKPLIALLPRKQDFVAAGLTGRAPNASRSSHVAFARQRVRRGSASSAA